MINKVDEKKIKDLIHSIGLNNYLSDSEIKKIVESQWRFTQETIKSLEIEDLTEEEILKLKTNFTYKHIGKLYTSPDIIRRSNLKRTIKEESRNERKELE